MRKNDADFTVDADGNLYKNFEIRDGQTNNEYLIWDIVEKLLDDESVSAEDIDQGLRAIRRLVIPFSKLKEEDEDCHNCKEYIINDKDN